MNDTLKQEEVAVPEKQWQPKKEKYVPPTIEVIQVKTERGYAASFEPIHNRRWS